MDDDTRQTMERLQRTMNESARLLMEAMPTLAALHEKLTDCPARCVALSEMEQTLVPVALGFSRAVLHMAAFQQEVNDG